MPEEKEKIYIAIDLKSFYASVECIERGLDPLKARLVVADEDRTEKTICLAVSPALKAFGIGGRARLFEVLEKTRQKKISFITAPPRMALYRDYSSKIFKIYTDYVSGNDIFPYSIDEVFIDASSYPGVTWDTARAFAMQMVKAILQQTGITATCGIGTNLFLAKIAMDIEAKHAQPDENGVRIAVLDEMMFRKKLWGHEPITDFWNVGPGTAKTLQKLGIKTMGDIARASIQHEDLLYKSFGVNAELLIDHAWGYESARIEDIISLTPKTKSLSSGQVLSRAYSVSEARVVLGEMTDALVLDLVDKNLVTPQMVINISCEEIGNIHGSVNLDSRCSSTRKIMDAVIGLYDEIMPDDAKIRRINVAASDTTVDDVQFEQTSLFDAEDLSKEKNMQKAILSIQKKYGKNALLKGLNFEQGATMIERNGQIGGHKA